MTCPDCTAALTNANHGLEDSSCHGCQVRALANGPQFWRSLQDRQRTPGYQAELEAVFGLEGADDGHRAVHAEYRRLKKLRGGTP